jgi:16S rRNA U516 pseudouridylate synthase RsuA-like enzyme
MVKVDGIAVTEQMLVSKENLIQISAKTGMYTPVKENTRIWLFHKPRELVTTHYDP